MRHFPIRQGFVSLFLFLMASVCIIPTAQASDAGSDVSQLPISSDVRELPLSNGGQQRILYVKPEKVRGVLIMLPGGAGDVGIELDGDVAHGKNFVVRTRDMWLQRGYGVIIPDALGGKNMRGQRSSAGYANVIKDLIAFAHKDAANVPVFLLGTSQGSIAAVNGAAHADKGMLAGVVLSESVTRQSKSGETVFDAAPERVNVPALIVANRDSQCRVAPAEDAARIALALKNAPEAKIVYVNGGETKSRDCGSQSPHGYLGIEGRVVDLIAGWLDGHR